MHLARCILLALLTAAVPLAAVRAGIDSYGGRRVVGYVSGMTRPTGAIDLTLLSHLVVRGPEPSADGGVAGGTIDAAALADWVAAAHAVDVDVSLAFGGPRRSAAFPALAADPARRARFVATVRDLLQGYGLDGAELAWQPLTGAPDRVAYAELLRQLAAALKPEGRRLSVSVGAFGHELEPDAYAALDWIAVRAYDMGWPRAEHASAADATQALAHWTGLRRAPARKLVLGLPTWGRAAAVGAAWPRRAYAEIVAEQDPPPYENWAGGYFFNGVELAEEKTLQVLAGGYGGLALADLTQDAAGPASLLAAVAAAAAAPEDDDTPPLPDPMDFAVLPHPAGPGRLEMLALSAADTSGVEYYFECTGGTDCSDSGWQSGPSFVASGLAPASTYHYRVKARDMSAGRNQTRPSASYAATTAGAEACKPHAVHVAAIWSTGRGLMVRVRDDCADAVAAVSVTASAGGTVLSAESDAGGDAWLALGDGAGATCVTALHRPGLAYAASANRVTCVGEAAPAER